MSALISAENAGGRQRRATLEAGKSEKQAGYDSTKVALSDLSSRYAMDKGFGVVGKVASKNTTVNNVLKQINKSRAKQIAYDSLKNTAKNTGKQQLNNITYDAIGKTIFGEKEWSKQKRLKGNTAYHTVINSILEAALKK